MPRWWYSEAGLCVQARVDKNVVIFDKSSEQILATLKGNTKKHQPGVPPLLSQLGWGSWWFPFCPSSCACHIPEARALLRHPHSESLPGHPS